MSEKSKDDPKKGPKGAKSFLDRKKSNVMDKLSKKGDKNKKRDLPKKYDYKANSK